MDYACWVWAVGALSAREVNAIGGVGDINSRFGGMMLMEGACGVLVWALLVSLAVIPF